MIVNYGGIAAVGVADLGQWFQNWSGSPNGLVQYLIILAVLLVMTLGAFVWAAFFRRHHRRHHHSHHRRSESPGAPAARDGDDPSSPRPSHHHHRRRRRRTERHLNPTLAQTGGLPPVRSGESDPPAHRA